MAYMYINEPGTVLNYSGNCFKAVSKDGVEKIVMHKDKERHPTLASDMIEEWRAVIVDSTVMSLVNGKEISPDNFFTYDDKPGVFIDKDGMKIFIRKLERKFITPSRYLAYADYPVSFRRGIGLQLEM
jgi:CRISPR-associated protein Cas1